MSKLAAFPRLSNGFPFISAFWHCIQWKIKVIEYLVSLNLFCLFLSIQSILRVWNCFMYVQHHFHVFRLGFKSFDAIFYETHFLVLTYNLESSDGIEKFMNHLRMVCNHQAFCAVNTYKCAWLALNPLGTVKNKQTIQYQSFRRAGISNNKTFGKLQTFVLRLEVKNSVNVSSTRLD